MAQGPYGPSGSSQGSRSIADQSNSTTPLLGEVDYDNRAMLRPAGFRPSRTSSRQGIGFSGTSYSRKLSSRKSNRISNGGRV